MWGLSQCNCRWTEWMTRHPWRNGWQRWWVRLLALCWAACAARALPARWQRRRSNGVAPLPARAPPQTIQPQGGQEEGVPLVNEVAVSVFGRDLMEGRGARRACRQGRAAAVSLQPTAAAAAAVRGVLACGCSPLLPCLGALATQASSRSTQRT